MEGEHVRPTPRTCAHSRHSNRVCDFAWNTNRGRLSNSPVAFTPPTLWIDFVVGAPLTVSSRYDSTLPFAATSISSVSSTFHSSPRFFALYRRTVSVQRKFGNGRRLRQRDLARLLDNPRPLFRRGRRSVLRNSRQDKSK
jgi:hypothetical protein